jgi:hypothetical protein
MLFYFINLQVVALVTFIDRIYAHGIRCFIVSKNKLYIMSFYRAKGFYSPQDYKK